MSTPNRPLVIYVEDDEDDQELCNFALEGCETDFELRFFADGRKVIDYVMELEKDPSGASQLPALVLLDLSMPAVNGWDVLEVLRSQPEFRKIPVVIFTTSNSPRDRSMAYEKGANAYMVKPAGLKELSALLHTSFKYWLDMVYQGGQ